MAIELEQRGVISEGAVRNVAVDLTLPLKNAGLLTGTPIVVHVDDDDVVYAGTIPPVLTITNKAVNVAPVEISGHLVAIGKAIQFSVSGQVRGNTYRIRISCGTTGTPAETLPYHYLLRCV